MSKDGFALRYQELYADGQRLLHDLGDSPVVGASREDYIAWMLSAMNWLEVVLPESSRYRQEAKRSLPSLHSTIFSSVFATFFGIFKSAGAEWSRGLLNTLELHFVGLCFEAFLKQASQSLEKGRRVEAAILASAVLEDTVKRLCRKHGIDVTNKPLEPLLNALKSGGVIRTFAR